MRVETTYFEGDDKDACSFRNDILVGLRRARVLGDHSGGNTLWDLWLIYLEERLGGMSPVQLERHFATSRVWQWFGPDPVIKTVDVPCVAYVLYRSTDTLTIVAVGACYEYPPGGADTWWRDVILPRLRSL